jgi:hypothetical protein
MMRRPGTPEFATAEKALATAKARLTEFTGNTAWSAAHRNDPAALARAAELVRQPLNR